MSKKYQNGKIYKITDNGNNKTYYGSTMKRYLCHRLSGHKYDYKKYLEGGPKESTSFNIFDEYGVDNCRIELVELYPCNSRDELESREGEFIRNNDCVNRIITKRTKKQYQEDNKEVLTMNKKKYRDTRKEEKRLYDKQRRLRMKTIVT